MTLTKKLPEVKKRKFCSLNLTNQKALFILFVYIFNKPTFPSRLKALGFLSEIP